MPSCNGHKVSKPNLLERTLMATLPHRCLLETWVSSQSSSMFHPQQFIQCSNQCSNQYSSQCSSQCSNKCSSQFRGRPHSNNSMSIPCSSLRVSLFSLSLYLYTSCSSQGDQLSPSRSSFLHRIRRQLLRATSPRKHHQLQIRVLATSQRVPLGL